MSVSAVKDYLAGYGLDGRVQEFSVSSATVELAAQALCTEPGRIAKTLSFKNGEGCVVLVAAGDRRVDNHKFKAEFGVKAAMLSHEDTLRLTGHAVGGVCPFALPEGVPVYLDESLRRFETVFPAAGSASSWSMALCSSGKVGSSTQIQLPSSSFSKRSVTSPSHSVRPVMPSTGTVWVAASFSSGSVFLWPQADSSSVSPSASAVRRSSRFIRISPFSGVSV